MRLENTWLEIRDHSFIQNHSRPFRFPAPCLCFFSSVHFTHLLRGSGQRTGMAIAEACFVLSDPFFLLFFYVLIIVRLEDLNMAHYKISNRVTYWFCICWYLIESMMSCVNKMSRTSSRNIGPQHQKYSNIFNYTHGVLFIPCSPNPSWVFAFFCFIWP